MFAYFWGLFSAQPEKYPHREAILAWTKYWYDHPLEVIDRDRSGRCLIMKYDDLMRSPDAEILRIYDRLGYSESKELRAILSDAVKSAENHVSKHRYSLDEMGFDRERLSTRIRA